MRGDPGPRLNSWKQIARYLGRDVRTVRRWENKGVGMPVHRVPGGRAVFAYTRELDAWLVDGTLRGELDAADKSFSRSRLRLSLGLMSVVAVGTVLVGLWPAPTREITSLETVGDNLVARDRAGDVVWSREIPGGRAFKSTARFTAVSGSDSEEERLFFVATARESAGEGQRVGAELFAFGTEGRVRWHTVRRDSFRFGRATFSDLWIPSALAVHDLPRGMRVAWAIHDYNWWPSALFLVDDLGSVEGPFVNSGWITITTFVRGPGAGVLLAGGISNSRMGAMIAVLDVADIRGHSPEEPGSEFECLDCPPGGPLRYLVFPPTDVNRASGRSYNETVGIDVGASEIRITVMEGPLFSDVVWVYHFTADFELIRATPGDSFWPTHELLELEGKLDHSAQACPWRVPPPILSWTPAEGWTELRVPSGP